MLRIPLQNFKSKQGTVSIICLKRILEHFGHIATKDGDNLEKLVVTGEEEGKDYLAVVLYVSLTILAAHLTLQSTYGAVLNQTENEQNTQVFK
ncbi:jg6212 [Pararge aegeria aegeria]|uniref:Jg6212 protein n=1 Tax=Pararge aegeria aegeria TaxID=348720 RepID=A0A8S4RNZ9_9NEOP|nr:jg6212 [Pararge aegeria aegeria]